MKIFLKKSNIIYGFKSPHISKLSMKLLEKQIDKIENIKKQKYFNNYFYDRKYII